MRLAQLIEQLKQRSIADPCPQFNSLIAWLKANMPDDTEYHRAYYIKNQQRKKKAAMDRLSKMDYEKRHKVAKDNAARMRAGRSAAKSQS